MDREDIKQSLEMVLCTKRWQRTQEVWASFDRMNPGNTVYRKRLLELLACAHLDGWATYRIVEKNGEEFPVWRLTGVARRPRATLTSASVRATQDREH